MPVSHTVSRSCVYFLSLDNVTFTALIICVHGNFTTHSTHNISHYRDESSFNQSMKTRTTSSVFFFFTHRWTENLTASSFSLEHISISQWYSRVHQVQVRVLKVWVRVLCIRVRVLKKGLESESLKIWTGVWLEYTVGLKYYITGISITVKYCTVKWHYYLTQQHSSHAKTMRTTDNITIDRTAG